MNLLDTFNPALLTANQIYFGYDMDDALRLVRYHPQGLEPRPGFYTDYFGMKTRLTNFPESPRKLDQAVGSFPFPDDGLHAELIEYLGAAKALEACGKDLTIVEMGAGYAPWLVFSAVVARQLGASKIRLVAVEAEPQRIDLIRDHFRENGFPQPEESRAGIETKIIHAAISDAPGSIYFGSAGIHDWGGAVQKEAGKDYRGADVPNQQVPARLMSDILGELPVVDLLHVDIQGWEAKAIRASLESVCARVRYMVIGTHSRVIEGELLELLRSRGWKLMHEKPCKFDFTDIEELAGATTLDGAQVWANPALDGRTDVPATLSDEERALAEQTRQRVGRQDSRPAPTWWQKLTGAA